MKLPPDPLPALPTVTLPHDTRLARIHRVGVDPWKLSSHDHGRFNLPHPWGTCYLAPDPICAFLEVFARHGAAIDAREISEYRLSWLRLDQDWELADLTNRTALGAGVNAEIHASTDYEFTRAWANAINQEHEGIQFRPRSDPSGSLTSVALFSVPGGRKAIIESSEEISSALLRQVEAQFDLRVVPARFRRRD